MANENKINWTLVVLGTILCIGLYLIPSPLQSTRRVVVHTVDSTWVVPGNPVISGKPIPTITGHSTSTVNAQPTDTSHHKPFLPYYFYKEVKDSSEEKGELTITSATYPYEENDSIKAEIIIGYEFNPRPAVIITQTDTVHISHGMKEVDVPFYEKPAFVIPATFTVTVGALYLLSRILK